jgi:SAM-dependent methyltransferase
MANRRSWDPSWEKVFRSQEWGKYPPEELVRFIARTFSRCPDRRAIRILDLGCGTGAATWYLAREGFSAFGIDGSKTAIELARARFKTEHLKADFSVGDFVRLDYPNAFFDCVIDIAAIQHNRMPAAARIVSEIRRILKPGGRLFSMLISRRSQFPEGADPTQGKGFVHLFSTAEVHTLFSGLADLGIERSERTDRGALVAHFVLTARNPA